MSCPFVIARDNVGLTLIDVKNFRAFMFTVSPITVNLFGNGDILRIIATQQGKCRILTLVQENEKAKLVGVDLPSDFYKALSTLATFKELKS